MNRSSFLCENKFKPRMVALKLSLFGSFQVHLHSQPLTHFESDKVRALLAYLAMESGRAHSRETLAGLLRPDSPDQAALTNLRHFETCRRLAEALAVEPAQETLRLYERIKAGEGLQPERWKVPPRPAPDHPSVPFVTREQELALLNRHLDSALVGDGRVVAWFTERFDTPDLIEAKALVDALEESS